MGKSFELCGETYYNILRSLALRKLCLFHYHCNTAEMRMASSFMYFMENRNFLGDAVAYLQMGLINFRNVSLQLHFSGKWSNLSYRLGPYLRQP